MRRFSAFPCRWAFALFLILGLAGCGTPPPRPADSASTATAGAQTYPYDGGAIRTRHRGSACALEWQGAIHAGALQRLRQALASLEAASCTTRTATLDALDGTVGDAITAGAMLRNRGWDTALVPGGACRTPCWLVFAAGTQRQIPDGSPPVRVVFSQVPPDADFGHQSCATELSRGQQLTLTRYLRAMLPSQTATAVYQKLLAADCRSADAYTPEQARLIGLATR